MDRGYVIPSTERLGPLHEGWRHRGLLWSLTLREIQVRYRQAFLGVLWAVAQPLALMVVTSLVFHRFLRVESGDIPYPLFVFTALVPWTFFHTAVTSAVPSLVMNANLVRKIYFPREALPLASVAATLLDLAAGLGVWVVMLAAYGTPVHATLLWVPVLLGLLVVSAVGPALLGAAVNVYFRDVKHALPLVLQLVFFATPIVYPLETVPPAWRVAFLLNPLTAVVEGLRRVALEGRPPEPDVLWIGTAVAVFLLLLAYALFIRAGRRFADVV